MLQKSFCEGWSFSKQDGQAQTVDLPHDAMILEQRIPDSPGGSAGAFFPAGEYKYEKVFFVPTDWESKHVEFQFEGVYRNSKVFINGNHAGGRPYGYIPYFVEADGFLTFGQENVIRVEVDNSELPDSRWYSGAGIYRPVWMWVGERTHIKPEGIRITTLSYDPAIIRVDIDHNGGDAEVEILSDGEAIQSGTGNSVEFEMTDAKLWSDESPKLYSCRVKLKKDGNIVDEAEETFGIRHIEWSSQGLLINGKNTLLRGACVHSDNGILGARSYPEAEERRVRILKEFGFNAIRASHNPASESMLDACDRHGIYVIDETWDMWRGKKSKHDYGGEIFEGNYKYDVEALVKRDYNHPSVIMYSIGNEIYDPYREEGVALGKDIVRQFQNLDKSRPVTCGVNLFLIHRASKGKGIYKEEGGMSIGEAKKSDGGKEKKEKASGSLFFNMMVSFIGTGMNKAANSKGADSVTSPFIDQLDIAGYNYASGRYRKDGKIHPDRIIMGSETFPHDIAKNWAMVKQCPYLIGDFMWTGWDYLGEAGLGAWSYTKDGKMMKRPYPWILADAGALDILGHPNGEAFRAAAVWGKLQNPAICVQPVNHPRISPQKSPWRGTNSIPSWSWEFCAGNRATVEVFFDAVEIELIQNNSSLGRKKVKDCKAVFKIIYTKGSLVAVAYDSVGEEIGRGTLETASGKKNIRISPETDYVKADGLAFVAVEIVGENGIVESNNDMKLKIIVNGGELLAFGSANPRTDEDYNSGVFTTYYGRAMAVVHRKEKGTAIVEAMSAGLETTRTEIDFI